MASCSEMLWLTQATHGMRCYSLKKRRTRHLRLAGVAASNGNHITRHCCCPRLRLWRARATLALAADKVRQQNANFVRKCGKQEGL